MNKSVRHILTAHCLLAASAVASSCGSQAPNELELGQLGAELRGEFALPDGVLSLEEDEEEPDPPPPSDCDCGPLVSFPPPGCARVNWFCNAVGSCGCEAPTAPEVGLLATGESSVAEMRAARVSLRDELALPDPSLRLDSEDPECKCLGATVSPPQGGCALVDWFCNASGLCRCRS
jgi:hypothetical protein